MSKNILLSFKKGKYYLYSHNNTCWHVNYCYTEYYEIWIKKEKKNDKIDLLLNTYNVVPKIVSTCNTLWNMRGKKLKIKLL